MTAPPQAQERQSADAVILIRPTGFGYDPETSTSNAFQRQVENSDVKRLAAEEFDALLAALFHCGVRTTVLDPVDRNAPNAVFPNNWFSTHADGRLVIYPMCTPSRRVERDPELANLLAKEGYAPGQTLDLAPLEQTGQYLEGTGSMVLDRVNRMAYTCLSPRTNADALEIWCAALGYTAVPFLATMDGNAQSEAVYHTNVVLSIGTRFAVVCLEAIPSSDARTRVEEQLAKSGREVIPISLDQMHHFVGNMLELRAALPTHSAVIGPRTGQGTYVFLSETAYAALEPYQRLALERHAELVPISIPIIEAVGGGSVRCMLAENFLLTRVEG